MQIPDTARNISIFFSILGFLCLVLALVIFLHEEGIFNKREKGKKNIVVSRK